MSQLKKKEKRPVGRPRADGRAHLTTEKLLKVTAKLIAQNGYTGTSFRMIARELDVTIASIFHLYPSKEALLNAMIAHAAKSSIAFYDEINAIPAAPPVKLFKSIVEEFRAVASVDQDYVAIFYLPELQREEFRPAQETRARMVAHFADLISAGIEAGDLRDCDAGWTAEQVFQLTETDIIAGSRTQPGMIDQRAIETARFCLRSLLKDQDKLPKIEAAAMKIDASIEIESYEDNERR